MAKNDSTSVLNRARAEALFGEIASVASNADRACYFAGIDGPDESLQLIIIRLREDICRIGWMADLGGALLNGGPIVTGARGDPQEWMLSPAYNLLGKAE